MRYNDTILEKMKETKLGKNGKISVKTQEISGQEVVPRIPEGSIGRKDIELPMPPLALTALRRYEIRYYIMRSTNGVFPFLVSLEICMKESRAGSNISLSAIVFDWCQVGLPMYLLFWKIWC